VGGDAGFLKWELPGWKSRFCPRQLVTAESAEWLRLFHLYKAGHLLVAGGLLDQPAIYVQTMSTIESLLARARSSE
jgi:hypothetical protein